MYLRSGTLDAALVADSSSNSLGLTSTTQVFFLMKQVLKFFITFSATVMNLLSSPALPAP